MALINCPECGRQVSDQAEKCPGCGAIINKKTAKKNAKQMKSKGRKKKLVIIGILIAILMGGSVASVVVYQSNVEKKRVAEQEKQKKLEETQKNNAVLKTETYETLCSVYEVCNGMIGTVGNAWKWAIFDSDDGSINRYDGSGANALADATGFTGKEVGAAYKDLNPEDFKIHAYMFITEPGNAVATIEKIYEKNGTCETLEGAMKEVKANIQKLGESDASYEKLKEFYTAVENYMDFVLAPTCSYQELSAIRNDYTSKIETCKSDLSFELGE